MKKIGLGYFKRPGQKSTLSDTKHKLHKIDIWVQSASDGSYGWANSTTSDDIYDRWNVTPSGATKLNDYRNIA